MILKIDIGKAFDKLKWSFIHKTLNYFKFPPNMIKLIMSCISSSNFTILVNGAKSDSFAPSRVIRQDDPMSPYIFYFVWKYFQE